MEKKKIKTADDVKTGLQIEGGSPVPPEKKGFSDTEKDLDDLVHHQKDPLPAPDKEIDPDDVVHKNKPGIKPADQEERDIDDLVHPS